MRRELELTKLPDSTWYREQAADGTLCWNGDADPQTHEAVELLRSIVAGVTALDSLAMLNDIGGAGSIYKVDDLVVKGFWGREWSRQPHVSGLPYLRASVGLHEGLAAIRPAIPDKLRSRKDIHFLYEAPRMFGSFIPKDQSGLKAVSVMSHAEGRDFWNPGTPRPTFYMRQAVYAMALRCAGLQPSDVCLDWRPQNTLLHPLDESTVLLTRLDAMGAKPRKSLGAQTVDDPSGPQLAFNEGGVFEGFAAAEE